MAAGLIASTNLLFSNLGIVQEAKGKGAENAVAMQRLVQQQSQLARDNAVANA